MLHNTMKIVLKIITIFLLFTSYTLSVSASDAVLYLSPGIGEYSIGSTFDINVFINTAGDPVNATQARVVFSPEELRVVGVDKTESILGSWTQMPAFSNEDGEVSFAGSTDESYVGETGHVLTITFEALKNVQTEISFLGGAAILADDGLATNILTEMRAGIYLLTPSQSTPEAVEIKTASTSKQITELISVTHPDSEVWYNEKDVFFSWGLTSDVESLRLLFDDSENSLPFVNYGDRLITEKNIKDVEDGVWYFHVQTYNGEEWSGVVNKQVNIDTTAPASLVIKETAREDLSDPAVSFSFIAVDDSSGVVKFETKIDDGEWLEEELVDGLFKPGAVTSGDHNLSVRAYDAAGNYTEDSKLFSVKYTSAPTVDEINSPLSEGDSLFIQGGAEPDSEIKVWIEREGTAPVEVVVQSDEKGIYSYVYDDKLIAGAYTVWTQMIDGEGLLSELSDRISIAVSEPPMASVGEQTLEYFMFVIPLLGFVILLAHLIITKTRKIKVYQEAVDVEAHEASDVTHNTFENIHSEMEEYFTLLKSAEKQRDLTKEEGEIKKFLATKFQDEEEIVQKEIEDIVEIEKVIPTKKIISVKVVD